MRGWRKRKFLDCMDDFYTLVSFANEVDKELCHHGWHCPVCKETHEPCSEWSQIELLLSRVKADVKFYGLFVDEFLEAEKQKEWGVEICHYSPNGKVVKFQHRQFDGKWTWRGCKTRSYS